MHKPFTTKQCVVYLICIVAAIIAMVCICRAMYHVPDVGKIEYTTCIGRITRVSSMSIDVSIENSLMQGGEETHIFDRPNYAGIKPGMVVDVTIPYWLFNDGSVLVKYGDIALSETTVRPAHSSLENNDVE